MTALIPFPIPQFYDIDGTPLNNGSIYIGLPNQNPQILAQQVSLFWDEAGTIAASQPIQTIGGFAARSGAPSRFYAAASTYSIAIYNKRSNLVTYQASTKDPVQSLRDDLSSSSGASLVGYSNTNLGALLLSGINRVVDSIVALRALDKTKFTRVFVSGYYLAGDGGGGNYWYDPSDTSSVDNAGTVIVASDGGRWKLVLQKRVSVKQFGAKGDGVFNDRPAFSAAAAAVLAIYVPVGQYLFGDDITVACRYGNTFEGESSHSTIQPGPGLVTLNQGSIILATSIVASPFTYYSGNQFKGLTFYYPNQLRTQTTPTVYPATFTWNGAGTTEVLTNNTWNTLQFVNAYIWIDALQGHLDYNYFDIIGCVIYRGIRTDGCGGTDKWQNFYASYYYWCQFTDPIQTWIQANSTGIEVGRSDMFFMDNLHIANLNAAIRFYKGVINTLSGPYGVISNLSMEGNNYGIYSEATHPIGINCTGLMLNNILIDIEIASGGEDVSSIQVTGFRSWGTHASTVRMNHAATVKLSDGEIFSCTDTGVRIGIGSGELSMDSVGFSSMGSQAPLVTTAQCNILMLSNNAFNQAPTLYATPATISRFRGNTFLSDGSVGG